MKKNRLGRTDMMVTDLCLGTMTYGTQTDEADAHAQIDMALDAGINFVDTAEMYPVNPIRLETLGRSEEIIGSWNEKTGRRGEYILATKHSGEGSVARSIMVRTDPTSAWRIERVASTSRITPLSVSIK